MFSIQAELQTLTVRLHEDAVPYALCGALALAVHGYPRATLDIDLLALAGSSDRILRCAHGLGFTQEAAAMNLGGGTVQIRRCSKVVPDIKDVLMLDVLSLSEQIERDITVETVEWRGALLQTVSREGLIRLKKLRGSTQDIADMEKLA